jgi:hypothetical protein
VREAGFGSSSTCARLDRDGAGPGANPQIRYASRSRLLGNHRLRSPDSMAIPTRRSHVQRCGDRASAGWNTTTFDGAPAETSSSRSASWHGSATDKAWHRRIESSTARPYGDDALTSRRQAPDPDRCEWPWTVRGLPTSSLKRRPSGCMAEHLGFAFDFSTADRSDPALGA